MKKYHTLDCNHEFSFVVLAINCHSKAYKICWTLNQKLGLNFEKADDHKIKKELFFTRYESKEKNTNGMHLIVNRSKKGYMIPSQKRINYFLIIKKENWLAEKYDFLSRLRAINDILLVFELDLEKEKNSDRFIIYDKKN